MLTKPVASRPTLTLPSRFPADVLFRASDASPSPSPMTLVSSFFAEQVPDSDFKSFSQLLAGAMAGSTPKAADGSDSFGVSTSSSQLSNVSGTVMKDSETKCSGVNGCPGVARSTIARFKTMTPSRLPIPMSSCLTIPPGLSPTTLLDSPVLLSAAQAQPSPTTGSFSLPPFVPGSGSINLHASDTRHDKYPGHDGSPSFWFKPFPKQGRNPVAPLAHMGPFEFSQQQVIAEVQAQVHTSSFFTPVVPSTVAASFTAPVPTGAFVSPVNVAMLVPPLQCQGTMGPLQQPLSESLEKVQPCKVTAPPIVVGRPSEDGYNWRKYGQKQVKGSEYPRSYYKCTYPNCPVKKKVERAHDGQVTEIVYKGEHNHAKPQSTRRMSVGTAYISDGGGREGSLSMKASGKAEGSNAILRPDGSDQVHPPDLKSERMELVSDLSSSSKGVFSAGVSGTLETSSGSTSDDEGEDCSKAEDQDIDEPDSKRRKKENDVDEAAIVPLRTIREPRVVVQTTSDIDILDDGYRWRKYGQKVVKGNPHPRSYYKCTNLGCSVRKHVERSSTDIRAVITTYEGKHNHDVPAARNSNINSNNDATGSAVNSVSLPALAHTGVGVNSVTKPCTSVQDQFYLGKLQEDRSKACDNIPMDLDLVSNGGIANRQLASDQWNRVCGGWEIPSQASMSLMSSGVGGRMPYESNESFGQSLILMAEEHGDGHTLGSSLQQAFPLVSHCQEMPQRLVLGP